MFENDSTLRNADESDDNQREKLEFDGSNRTLNDYVELGGLDCLQLDDDAIEHYDDIASLDDANEAVIEQGMAIRVQPPAPDPTVFYFGDGSDWKRQVAGHDLAKTVSAESVRATVKSAIAKNDSMGGGGVKAVSAETVETCPEPDDDDGEDERLIECRECRTAAPISEMIEIEHIPKNEDGIALEIRRRFVCSRGCARAGQIMTDGGQVVEDDTEQIKEDLGLVDLDVDVWIDDDGVQLFFAPGALSGDVIDRIIESDHEPVDINFDSRSIVIDRLEGGR